MGIDWNLVRKRLKTRECMAWACFLAAGLLTGCSAGDPQGAFDEGVRRPVAARLGRGAVWRRGGPEEVQADVAVTALLKKPLTAGSAVQIALLNNRTLQAQFAEVGISYGEFITAGLLKNPTLAASGRFPDRAGLVADWEAAVTQDFLDALLLPLRKRLAAEQLRAVEGRVADEGFKTAVEVERAFYTYQARRQLVGRLRLVAETNGAAADFTRSLHDAGNVNDLDLVNQQATYSQSKIDVTQARAQTLGDREAVNRLLGLDGAQAAAWTAAKVLPPIPGSEPSAAKLEALAVAQRLDLQVARAQLAAAERALALRVGTRYLPAGVTLGVDTEREPGGEHITGPTLDLELPIFNQGQGEIATLRARDLQARRLVEAKIIDMRSEVRAAHAQVAANRELALAIRNTILPQRRRALVLTLQQYNGMLKGAYDLLTAKANEATAERAYIEAWRDYWLARADLERAVGGRLPGGAKEPTRR